MIKRILMIVFILSALSIQIVSVANAGQASHPLKIAVAPFVDVTIASDFSVSTLSKKDYTGRRVSLALVNKDVRKLLDLFPQVLKKNLTISPEVRGSITCYMADIPADLALELIAGELGLDFKEDKTSYFIGTGKANRAEGKESESVKQGSRINPEVIKKYGIYMAVGDPEIAWLSNGLADVAVTDIPYLHGWNLSDKFYNQYHDIAPKYASSGSGGADFILTGRYKRNKDTGEIAVENELVSTATGSVIAGKIISGDISQLMAKEAGAILDLSQAAGISVDEAEKARVLSRKTDSAEAWRQNAEMRKFEDIYGSRKKENKKELAEWEAGLTRAVQIDPAYAEAWNNLGRIYLLTGEIQKAESAFETALRLKPFLIESNAGMGKVYEGRDNEKAAAAYRKAVDFNPSLEKNRLSLFMTLVKLQKGEEAGALVVPLMKSRSAGVRDRVASNLWRLKDEKVLSSVKAGLAELLKDPDPGVRSSSTEALNNMKKEQ
jgi:tetratricopeptide (TPR) repeat protein